MRIILNGLLLDPTDGAIIPEIAKRGAEQVTDQVLSGVTDGIIHWMHDGGIWFMTQGIPILAELTLLATLVCYLVATSGKGKWIERGAKMMILSMMLNLSRCFT